MIENKNLIASKVQFKCKCSHISNVQQYQCQVKLKYNDQEISVDGCLWQEILYLLNKGIRTIGSCCGNHIDSYIDSAYIQVSRDSIQKMLYLGYVPIINRHNNIIFKPKTIIEREINDR